MLGLASIVNFIKSELLDILSIVAEDIKESIKHQLAETSQELRDSCYEMLDDDDWEFTEAEIRSMSANEIQSLHQSHKDELAGIAREQAAIRNAQATIADVAHNDEVLNEVDTLIEFEPSA